MRKRNQFNPPEDNVSLSFSDLAMLGTRPGKQKEEKAPHFFFFDWRKRITFIHPNAIKK